MAAGRTRVLLFDIETSPNIAYIWGKYEQDALGDFVKERQIISFAWKWLGEKIVRVLALPMFKGYKKHPDDNRELITRLHKIISAADVVVGHNVDEFDDKMANAEFISYGLPPPPPHKTVDTLKVAKAKFRFNSNKLGDLGRRLGLGKKVDTGGFELWAGCLRGNRKSWARMMKYNKQDVVLLEKIYLKLRPWMGNHPDMNAIDGKIGCPICKSPNLQSRGWSISGSGRRKRFQCKACSKWSVGKLVKGEWKFR
jgi:hypothetical protein